MMLGRNGISSPHSASSTTCFWGEIHFSPKRERERVRLRQQTLSFTEIYRSYTTTVCKTAMGPIFLFVSILSLTSLVNSMIITSVLGGPKKYKTVSFDLLPFPLAW